MVAESMVFELDSASIPILDIPLSPPVEESPALFLPILCPLRYRSDSIVIRKLRGTIGY